MRSTPIPPETLRTVKVSRVPLPRREMTHALEDLDALLGALPDPDVDLDRVSGPEVRQAVLHVLLLNPL